MGIRRIGRSILTSSWVAACPSLACRRAQPGRLGGWCWVGGGVRGCEEGSRALGVSLGGWSDWLWGGWAVVVWEGGVGGGNQEGGSYDDDAAADRQIPVVPRVPQAAAVSGDRQLQVAALGELGGGLELRAGRVGVGPDDGEAGALPERR